MQFLLVDATDYKTSRWKAHTIQAAICDRQDEIAFRPDKYHAGPRLKLNRHVAVDVFA